MAHNLEIIVGTYEEFLLGYKLHFKDGKEVLTQSFADKSHLGALKCLDVYKYYIASGATDDRIFIYDMRSRKQSQILLSHQGTVNALAFTPDGSHLLSGGDDAKMQAVRLNTWAVEGCWKQAHSGKAVSHIKCHPSGKLALSLGGDLILRTWNLVKGRVAYKKNIKSHLSLAHQPDNLCFSTSGEYFTLTGQRVVEIWSLLKADVVHSQKTTSKPSSLCWISRDKCLVGLEDGKIMRVKIDKEEEGNVDVLTFDAHTARVKCLASIGNVLTSASSNGELKLWEFDAKCTKLRELSSVNIGCRPTCIGLLNLREFETEFKGSKELKELKELPVENERKPSLQNRGKVVIEYEFNDDEEKTAEKILGNKKKKMVNKKEENDSEDEGENEDSDEEENEDSNEEDSEDEKSEEDVPEVRQKKRKVEKPIKNVNVFKKKARK